MLINRRKVDFRLYVGLFFNAQERSYSAFLFRDGIARLCSREYDINNIQCLRAHLTNTSINGEHETAFLKARMPYTDALSILSVTYNVDKAIMEALIKRVIIIGILTGIVGTSNIGGMHQMEACFELWAPIYCCHMMQRQGHPMHTCWSLMPARLWPLTALLTRKSSPK